MKRKRLLMAVALLLSAMAWAQSQPVVMNLTDIYGDTQQVELKGGETIYLSQLRWGNVWQNYYGSPSGSLVMCDANGVPCYQMAMEELASITYTGAVGQTSYSLPDYTEPTPDSQNWMRWRVGGRDYTILLPGEWKVSENLQTLTLTTAEGKNYQMPLAAVEQIWRCDPGATASNWLSSALDDARIYNWAFYNGNGYYGRNDYMGLNFYASLPAYEGEKNLTLLVPTDEGLSHYTDIVSFNSKIPRLIRFYNQSGNFAIGAEAYQYNKDTHEVGGRYGATASAANQTEIVNRLGIILRSHAIYHSRPEDKGLGLRSGNEYFTTLDGSVVRVVKDAQGEPIAVQGAYELQNEQQGLTNVTITEKNNGVYTTPWSLKRANITERIEKGSAWVYKIDNALNASPRSVWNVLTANGTYPEDNPYKAFIELCEPNNDIIVSCGLVDESLTVSQRNTQLKRYCPFIELNGLDQNLNFVGNCPFTLYVPTNDAVNREVSSGRLFTWEQIAAQFAALPKDEEGTPFLSLEDSLSLQRKILTLTNFIRAHIQFGLEIADQLPFEREHNTAVVKEHSLATPRLIVRGLGKGKMTVTDELGNTRNVLDAHKNIFVREVSCSKTIKNVRDLRSITINGYATGAIHQIDGVLKYRE